MTNVLHQASGEKWNFYHSDAVDLLREIPDRSIDYIIYSPPFGDGLYVYSNSERDIGNTKSYDEFFAHYHFVSAELMRVLKTGRLMSIHCMLLPRMKERHGFIGLQDFRGDLIRAHQADGMIFHSEVTIWKDPVVAMQRTKSIGLLYKQLRKDSSISRQGVPDYLVTMRKPGVNPDPITKDSASFPVVQWQNYASPVWCEVSHEEAQQKQRRRFESTVRPDDGDGEELITTPDDFEHLPVEFWNRYQLPVWMDINPSDTLQRTSAREEKDERHIAPLQLEVIRRGIQLWTNPGEVVLSPFGGIASEGFVAIKEGRRFIGAS